MKYGSLRGSGRRISFRTDKNRKRLILTGPLHESTQYLFDVTQ